jgi:hypothetical protein
VSDFVVEASVVLTWCFPDEHSAEAGRIPDLMRVPGNRSLVPAFFPQEVLNELLTIDLTRALSVHQGSTHVFVGHSV